MTYAGKMVDGILRSLNNLCRIITILEHPKSS